MKEEDHKGKPIPVRFEPDEDEMITELKRKTGLTRSEIIRRSVRLLRNRIQETGNPNVLYELPPTYRVAVALVRTDARGKVIFIDAAFSQMCGYTLKELRGKKPGDVLQGPATEKDVVRDFRKAIKAIKPFTCTLSNYHKNGALYHVHIQMRPLFEGSKHIGFEALERRLD